MTEQAGLEHPSGAEPGYYHPDADADTEGHMPRVRYGDEQRTADEERAEDEPDTEGHWRVSARGDAERAEGDDTEGHSRMHTADTEQAESDDTEGHGSKHR